MRNPPGVTVTALPPHLKGWRLRVGLQVEEPGSVQYASAVEVQAANGIREATFEPQTLNVDDLLGVGQSRRMARHHVRNHRSRSSRLHIVGDEDVKPRNLTD